MIKFYNTLTRKKEEFRPLKGKEVGLYTCGPTVYWFAHIGNLRTYIFEDILKRILEYNDYKVKHVMNITDVGHLTSDADTGEDKMEKSHNNALYLECQKCKKVFFSGIIGNPILENNYHQCPYCRFWNLAKNNSSYLKKEKHNKERSIWEIAEFYTKVFKEDLKNLNIEEPTIWTKATDYIKEQIQLIEILEKRGFTYKISDGIYFDSSKIKDYGKLAGKKPRKIKAGVRVKIVSGKKNPTDFALWKFAPSGVKRQMEWDSPWGKGFPGWHTECVVMSLKHLGIPFDIHTGGIDHIPIHHTNEIAQAEAAFCQNLANFWLHGEFLISKEGKMAKSKGNITVLKDLVEKQINPLAYRYLCLTTHYRAKLTFSFSALKSAQNALNKLYQQMAEINKEKGERKESSKIIKDYKEKFLNFINNDLDTPKALALMWKIVKSPKISGQEKYSLLTDFDKVFGLGLNKIKKQEVPEEIEKMAREREKLRKEGKWQESDEIRKKVKELGWQIEDTEKGPKIKPINN